MRPHGRSRTDPGSPRAHAICQRCGFEYNRVDLQSQHDWQFGPRLRDLMIWVCPECYDTPQESGRTIILPPDPVPIQLPFPEDYASADNPLSPLGFNVANLSTPVMPQALSGSIGNMTMSGGVDAAFDGSAQKRLPMSASLAVSNSSFNNWVGKNWNVDPSGTSISLASSVAAVTHILANAVLVAPFDARFLNAGATGVHIDGSSNGTTWTTLASTTTVGTVNETLTVTSTVTTSYQYHRVNLQGNGFSTVAIAQAEFNVSDAQPNDI